MLGRTYHLFMTVFAVCLQALSKAAYNNPSLAELSNEHVGKLTADLLDRLTPEQDLTAASPNQNVQFLASHYLSLLGYMALYSGVRTGNFDLRMAGLEWLAPIFFSYAKPKYMDLLASAMANKMLLPAHILEQFEKGEFVVSAEGHQGRSQAMDEAHETNINRYTAHIAVIVNE